MEKKEKALQPGRKSADLHQQLLELRNWELSQTQIAPEESEARLRAFFEYSPIGVCLLDTGLRFVAVNKRLAALNDLSPAAFLGRTVQEMLGNMGEKLEPLLLQVLSSEQPVLNVELVGSTAYPQGKPGYWFVSCFPIFEPEQQSTALGLVVIDITEIKQTEMALRASEERLKEAENVARLGHYEIEPATNRVVWSDQTYRIFGLDPAAAPPDLLSYQRLIHQDDREQVYRLFEECIREVKSFELIYRIVRPDGAVRYVHSVGRTQKDVQAGTLTMFGTIQDVTERVEAEKLLKMQVHYQEVLARCSRTLLRPIITRADQQQILKEALEHLREGIRARRVILFENFYDPEQGLCAQYVAEATAPDARPYQEIFQAQVIPWATTSQKARRQLEAGKSWSGSAAELIVNLPVISLPADTASSHLFPIHFSGYWWGVICFGDCMVEGIWADHERLLRTASEMIGQFLQRRQFNTDLRQRVKELSALNLIAQTMATVTELSIALNLVANTVARLFEAFSTAISLLNEEDTELKVVAHSQAGPDVPEVVGLVFSPPGHEPHLNRVIQQRRTLIIPPAQTSLLIQRLHPGARVRDIHQLLLVPLLARGKVIGILSISLDQAGRRFTSSEISLAETVASQVGSAIETVRLFTRERRQRRMAESLREVATSLNSTLDREIVLEKLFEQLDRVIHHNGGSIFLLDGDDLVLANGAGSARQLIGRRVPLNTLDPAVRVFVEKRPYIVADTSVEPNWIPWERPRPILSWMGAPLLIGSEAIGVLGVDNYIPGAYSREDAEILLAFANQAATAIQNARLYEQTQQDAVAKSELLQEVNHRVKNNLMAIRGLLLVERSQALNEGRVHVTELLESLDQRIHGLAKVHDVLSRSQWGPVSLQDLASQIIQEALKALVPDHPIRLEVAPSPVTVSPRQASSLALVINELATNTIKYAQPVSSITVSSFAENGMIQLEYRDNGPGYPDAVLHRADGAEMAPASSGNGLLLLRRIVTGTLHGRVTIANEAGAVVRIQFKTDENKSA